MPQEAFGPVNAKAYHDKGFAPVDISLTPGEFGEITRYLDNRANSDHPGNIHDAQGRLRAVHGFDEGFAPTLIERLSSIAKTLTGCRETYVYQFRANIKHPSENDSGGWQPHRDFDYWQHNDGMPSSRAVVFHVLVTDHTENNGPLVLCNASHKVTSANVITTGEDNWQANFGEDLKFTIQEQAVSDWKDKTVLLGSAGDIYAMHPLTWHYSEPNRSKGVRTLLSIVFNDLDNQPVLPEGAAQRPEFIVEQPRARS